MATSENDKHTKTENVLHFIRGLPMGDWFNPKNIEDICEFMPGDGDVIIATYPKTGTTWMQYIVLQILSRGESFPSFNDVLEKVVPYLEMSGVSAVDELTTRPRVYKHHMPYNMVKKNSNAKVIYVYRRPEDTFVSYFHFMKNLTIDIDFDSFFEDYLTGYVSYGRYFEHILSYLEYKDDDNMLLVSYEQLQVHRKEGILRVAKFLGEEHHDALVNDEAVLNKIIEQTSFDYMKKNLSLTMPTNPQKAFIRDETLKDAPKIKVDFFRKGVVGEGKKTLKESQLHRLRELVKETMKGTDVLLEWLQE